MPHGARRFSSVSICPTPSRDRFASTMLGDYGGGEIIKIEPLGRREFARAVGPPPFLTATSRRNFVNLNRKQEKRRPRSEATPTARRFSSGLLERARDVVLEKPCGSGTRRIGSGLGYQQVRERQPRHHLLLESRGLDQDGPYRNRAAFRPSSFQAESGMISRPPADPGRDAGGPPARRVRSPTSRPGCTRRSASSPPPPPPTRSQTTWARAVSIDVSDARRPASRFRVWEDDRAPMVRRRHRPGFRSARPYGAACCRIRTFGRTRRHNTTGARTIAIRASAKRQGCGGRSVPPGRTRRAQKDDPSLRPPTRRGNANRPDADRRASGGVSARRRMRNGKRFCCPRVSRWAAVKPRWNAAVHAPRRSRPAGRRSSSATHPVGGRGEDDPHRPCGCRKTPGSVRNSPAARCSVQHTEQVLRERLAIGDDEIAPPWGGTA